MTRRGSFGREWSLIKLAKGWRFKEISNEILSELIATAEPPLQYRIQEIARTIGAREATQFLDRVPPGMDTATTLESFLLVAGIHCTVTPAATAKVLHISTDPGELFSDEARGHEIVRSFLTGAAATIVHGAEIHGEDGALVVTIPDRLPFRR